ncbi:MAG: hypothetical protein FJ276_28015 [Planctomycetes bacterium]|nr:hypothetical protein [Planctomycetota bacterium]
MNLLSLRDELHRRGFTSPDRVTIEQHDVTDLFASSSLEFLQRAAFERYVAQGQRRVGFELLEGPFCVRAVRLPGLAGTLAWPSQPELNFAHELAGRVRVIACLDQQPILLHSEKWPDYAGAKQELDRLKKKTGCGLDDSVVIVWGVAQDTRVAADEIRIRYADATLGVPNETRQPLPDGSTDFERILPGPDRMYPDTDSPPHRILPERTARLQATLPDPPWVREERYAAAGVPREVIHFLIRRGGARLVDLIVDQAGADVRAACFFFGQRLKGLRRAGVAVDAVTDARWCEYFRATAAHEGLADAWKSLVVRMAQHADVTVAELVSRDGLATPPENWREELRALAAHHTPLHSDGTRAQRLRFLMGLAMRTLRGRVDARNVAATLNHLLEDVL